MCYFFSAVVLKSGEIVYDINTNSHEDLIESRNLEDNTIDPRELTFARVEILPPQGDFFSEPDKWNLKIDENITPVWFDDEIRKNCMELFAKEIYPKCIFIDKKNLEFRNRNNLFFKNCKARLYNNSSAKLYDNSLANLHDNSLAKLYGNSSANLYDNSLANLYHKSSANLYGKSLANLYNYSLANLYDESSANLYDKSLANLYGKSLANLYNYSLANLYGKSSAINYSKYTKFKIVDDLSVVIDRTTTDKVKIFKKESL